MKKIYLFTLIVAFGISLIFASQASAVLAPRVEIRDTENMRVNITATPTSTVVPTLAVTIKPSDRVINRLVLKKTNAIKEIERRLESFKKLSSKVLEIKKLTASQKEALIAQIQVEITKLEDLKIKVNSETNSEALVEEKKMISESYKVYALYIPKIEIMVHSNKIIEIADAMSAKTKNTTLLTKIADSKTKAQTAYDLVFPLVPEDYPDFKATLKTARDLLKTARTSLNDVFPSLKNTK